MIPGIQDFLGMRTLLVIEIHHDSIPRTLNCRLGTPVTNTNSSLFGFQLLRNPFGKFIENQTFKRNSRSQRKDAHMQTSNSWFHSNKRYIQTGSWIIHFFHIAVKAMSWSFIGPSIYLICRHSGTKSKRTINSTKAQLNKRAKAQINPAQYLLAFNDPRNPRFSC